MPMTDEQLEIVKAAIFLEENLPQLKQQIKDEQTRHQFALAAVLNDEKAAIAALGYSSKLLAKAQGHQLFVECQKKIEEWEKQGN